MSWFEGLDADTQAHITSKGWEKLEGDAAAAEAVKAHFAAQKMMGVPAEQLLRVPKDATDPAYQSAYDRIAGLGVPAEPAAYTFEEVRFKDGTALAEEDAAFVREAAVKYKLPVHVARGLAADLAARADSFAAVEAAGLETAKAANAAYLRASYGADYDLKTFSATRAAEAAGFPPEVLASIAGLPQERYKAAIDAFVSLGSRMNEAAALRGGGVPDSTMGLNGDTAQARLDVLKEDKSWVQKFIAGDSGARDDFTKLTTIIAESRVPRR